MYLQRSVLYVPCRRWHPLRYFCSSLIATITRNCTKCNKIKRHLITTEDQHPTKIEVHIQGGIWGRRHAVTWKCWLRRGAPRSFSRLGLHGEASRALPASYVAETRPKMILTHFGADENEYCEFGDLGVNAVNGKNSSSKVLYLESPTLICLFTMQLYGSTMMIKGSLLLSIPIVKRFQTNK